MTKTLMQWLMAGAALSQFNAAKFEQVLEAVGRIAEAERLLQEVPAPGFSDAIVPDLLKRFKN